MGENEFDGLFNEYFGNKNKMTNDGIAKMLNLMSKLNSNEIDGDAEANLGEPDTKRLFEKDGIIYEESTWSTEYGTIVKIMVKENVEFSKESFNKNNIPLGKPLSKSPIIKKELSLEDQLKIAVKNENYEKAAELRDLISKKENKNISPENLDNKGITDNDGWNF